MTTIEYALYRCATQRMTPEELAFAKRLAEIGDKHKDTEARRTLWKMTLDVIRRGPAEKANAR